MKYFPFACVLLMSCSLHRVEENIEPPSFSPPAYSASGEVPVPQRWWDAFADPHLDHLIGSALEGNLDLQAAWARLDQFRALEMKANRMPRLSAEAGTGRARTASGDGSVTGNSYNLGVSASWEVDLWKRLESLDRAEALNTLAVRQDLEATALALSAAVARTRYGILAQKETMVLLDELVDTNQKLLDVIEVRFENAQGTAVAVFQQREQLATVKASVPLARARLELLNHQLAVLLGRSPTGEIPTDGEVLPDLPPLPATGLPAELIQNRPDLRAATLRVAAADYRLGAAIAARYPSLRLTGGSGYGARELGDLFSNWVWNLFAGLTAPILDGNSLKSEELRNRALLRETVINYEQTSLRALREVEDALSQERNQTEYLDRLVEQEQLARSALDSGRSRFLEGVGDFLTVLTEIQALQRIQSSLIEGRRQKLEDRISLYQALGGHWTAQLTNDPARDLTPIGGTSQ